MMSNGGATNDTEQQETSVAANDGTKKVSRRRSRNSILCTMLLLLLVSLVSWIADRGEMIEVKTYTTENTTSPILVRERSNPQGYDGSRQQHAHHSQEQQNHCIIHIHGFHHSGTGFLRKAVYESLGEDYASVHEHTRKAEDEGQHIQGVYPPFYTRKQFCTNENLHTSFGRLYYCPEMLNIPTKQNNQVLFQQWSRYWNMTKPFLIQKTPTMDVLFLEMMKTTNTIHVIVMRHPFACRPVLASKEQKAIFTLCTWLDVWAHVLDTLSNHRVASFAIVNYEAMVENHEVSLQLSTMIRDECGIAVENPTTIPSERMRRRLPLRLGNSSQYLDLSKFTLRKWNLCEENQVCHELMDKLTPLIAEFGYNWDRDSYYVKHNTDSNLLYSSNNIPPKEVVKSMNELATKYCTN